MSDVLEYAEKSGLENLKFRLQNAETLAKEANTTLTMLLAGIGGSMAYAVKGFEQATPSVLAIGAIFFAAFLMATAAVLVVFCILTTNLPAPTNEPKNLYQQDFTLDAIRAVELRNIDERIKQITARNHRVAAWLDRVRLLTISSPLVWLLSALAWVALLPARASLV